MALTELEDSWRQLALEVLVTTAENGERDKICMYCSYVGSIMLNEVIFANSMYGCAVRQRSDVYCTDV